MASTYLSRTPSSSGNRKIMTFSFWVKRSALGSTERIFSTWSNSAANQFWIRWTSSNELYLVSYTSSSFTTQLITTQLFRDVSAWYHIVIAYDTTQATASNRIKLYVNGTQVTAFSTETYPTQNTDMEWNRSTAPNIIGGEPTGGNGEYFNGAMAHVHFIDGTAYAASDFGEFDANGIWTPNASPSVTYGTNGFFLDMANSSDMGNDVSGNNNDFSVGAGTVTQALDTPSNVFSTWNPTLAMNSTMTLANGNLTGTTGSNYAAGASNSWFSTLGAKQGKWYAEFKLSAATINQAQIVGVGYDLSKHQQGSNSGAYNLYSISEGWGYIGAEGKVKNNDTDVLTGLTTWYTGDIVCVALDLDNYKLYYRINGGSWENSGDPTSGATGTGAISLTTDKEYFFGVSDASLANTYTFQANFGNGYFGTTAVASGNADSAGLGIFEYTVPSGYYSLCTKNIATYG